MCRRELAVCLQGRVSAVGKGHVNALAAKFGLLTETIVRLRQAATTLESAETQTRGPFEPVADIASTTVSHGVFLR